MRAVAWWFSLAGAVAVLRDRMSVATLPKVKRASGFAILGFAVYALVSGLM